MQEMMDFSTWLLGAIADFLMSPPISYLVGFMMLAIALNIILTITRPR